MKAFKSLPPVAQGAIWMIACGFAATAMYVLVRRLATDYSPFQLMFMRNVVSAAILAPWTYREGGAIYKNAQISSHCARAALAVLGMAGLFFGLARLPIADATALSFTQPLFIVLLAGIVLGETVGRQRWGAALVGFAGILVIVRPGFADINVGILFMLGSALFYAGSNVAIALLVRKDSVSVVTAYGNILQLPLTLVPALIFWRTPGWAEGLAMLGIGVVGLGVQLSLSRAYQAADASAVVPFDFLRLPFAALVGYLLFAERVDGWTWAGAAVVFASSYALLRLERRATRSPAPASRP